MPQALPRNGACAGRHRIPYRKFGVCFEAGWDYALVSDYYLLPVASEYGRYWVSGGLRKCEKREWEGQIFST